MTTKQIHRTRAALALGLRLNGAKFDDIAAILKAGSKERARQLSAKGRRLDKKLCVVFWGDHEACKS